MQDLFNGFVRALQVYGLRTEQHTNERFNKALNHMQIMYFCDCE